MESLQNLCYHHLVESLQNAPPLLQEIIIGETYERIKDNIKKELLTDLKKESNLIFCKYLPVIIPEIMQDIVSHMEETDYIPRDFCKEFSRVPKEIVECAIQITIELFQKLEALYIYRTFNISVPITPIIVDSDDDDESGWYD